MLRISQSSMQTSAFHFVFLKPFAVVMIAVQMVWCVLYTLEVEYDVYDPISRRRVYLYIYIYIVVGEYTVPYITISCLYLLTYCTQCQHCLISDLYVFSSINSIMKSRRSKLKAPLFHTHSSRHIENPLPNNTSLKTAEPFLVGNFSPSIWSIRKCCLKLDCSPWGLGWKIVQKSLNPTPRTPWTQQKQPLQFWWFQKPAFFFNFASEFKLVKINHPCNQISSSSTRGSVEGLGPLQDEISWKK